MDRFDVQLLNLLQADSRLTVDELAQRVPLSASAISRRIKRLWDEGVIAGPVAVLSPRLRDRRLTAVIDVQLDRHRPMDWELLKRALAKAPEVQLCLEISGASDVLLVVSVADMDHFNRFADALGAEPLVRRYETSFVKRHVKTSLAVALEEEG